MGAFAPTLLAFFQNLYGVYMFTDSKTPGCEPLVSCLIFLLAVFLLLLEVELYPRSLRKQYGYMQLFVEYLLNAFIIEHIMNDFWFPLEHSVGIVLPAIADWETTNKGDGYLKHLRSGNTAVVASYLLSIFFLVAVLHATRIIDLRLLSCGTGHFVEDIKYRSNKTFKKVFPQFLKFSKKRVKFRKGRSASRTRSKPRVTKKSRKPEITTDFLREYLSSCSDSS